MEEEKRSERHIPCLDIVAHVNAANNIKKANLINITKGGACLDEIISPVSKATVTLLRNTRNNFCSIKKRDCKIIKHKGQPHTGIQFFNRLTQEEIEMLGIPKKDKIDFAKLDYDTVHREIMDIKSCRTNLFIGTIGVIGAAGIAILGIIGGRDANAPLLAWLPWAAAIPTLLLTSAILATIHKARGINERVGYLEALAEVLTGSSTPENFRGWPQANYVSRSCRIYRDAWNLWDKCPFDQNKNHCINDAETAAYDKINKYIGWRPDLLSSFTSLSTYIYSIAYAISLITLLWATMISLRNYISSKTPQINYFDFIFWIAVVVGAVITATIANRIFKLKYKNQHKSPQKIKHENWFKWCGFISSGLVPLLITGLVVAYKNDMKTSSLAMIAYSIGAMIAVAATYMGYSFYEKVNSLRRGIYSIICWRHIWKLRLEQCNLMKGEIPNKPYTNVIS